MFFYEQSNVLKYIFLMFIYVYLKIYISYYRINNIFFTIDYNFIKYDMYKTNMYYKTFVKKSFY